MPLTCIALTASADLEQTDSAVLRPCGTRASSELATMKLATLTCALLAGCAFTPQQMARQSNYDVCRFTMGGPHSAVADAEARRRGLDCSSMYGAIAAQEQARNAATANFLRSINPPPRPAPAPINCTSYRIGNTVQTDCR